MMCTTFIRLFTPIFFLVVLVVTAKGQTNCPPESRILRLKIDSDQFWQEISWTITNFDGSIVWHKDRCDFDSLLTRTYCVPKGECILFKITDEYGDGMAPDGHYTLYLDDNWVYSNQKGNFGRGETVFLGCPEGAHCSNPLPAQTGTLKPYGPGEAWYQFVPPSNGTYELTTCGQPIACSTAIWVYNQCKDLLLSTGPTGAIFFSNKGCDSLGATATLFLAAGQTYYFRIARTGEGGVLCKDKPIYAELIYRGPVVGCMNPKACNYNPLAEIQSECIFPDDPRCSDGPDLMIREDSLRNQLRLGYVPAADECAVLDGCFRGVKERYMLEFGTYIQNIGNRDFYVGSPPTDTTKNDGRFFWDLCHQHWHYRGYAEYLLFDAVGRRIPGGTKLGFCVFDRECNNGGMSKFSCRNMGISAGCGDFYERALPCQAVDITGLNSGNYTLAVRVNWNQLPDAKGRVERAFDNNWAQACFNLSYTVAGKPVLKALPETCKPYFDCLGVRFGSAQPDCEGKCNGTVFHGDWNRDGQRNNDDIKGYLTGILNQATSSVCNDLFADGALDVYDAALLQECVQYPASNAHWALRFPCQFPGGLQNSNDLIQLLTTPANTTAQTIDIQIINPGNGVMGYDFFLRGVEIEKIDNLVPGFLADIQFNKEGRILALGRAESPVLPSKTPRALLRIKYKRLTGEPVCIPARMTVVNDQYQKSEAKAGAGRCRVIQVTGRSGRPGNNVGLYIMPNPFGESTMIYFDNPERAPLRLELADAAGRVVRTDTDVTTDSFRLERGMLPPGIYFVCISGSFGKVTERVVME